MGSSSSKSVSPEDRRDRDRTLAASKKVEPIRGKLQKLGASLEGSVLLPPSSDSENLLGGPDGTDEEAYHRQRERPFYLNDWNYPCAIVLPASEDDVVKAIKVIKALPSEYRLSVACGAHSSYGFVDQAICLDLCNLNAAHIDAEARRMRIGGGAKIEVAHEALRGTNLGFVTGTNPDTGVSGLTMAGGAGYLAPQAGFACDTVVAAKVVLPNGKLVAATDTNEYADLLRALRGGGGNFGIVTEWTFQLVDVTHAFGGTVVHMAPTMKSIKKVLASYADAWSDPNVPNAACSLSVLPVGAPVFVDIETMIGPEVKDAISYKDIPHMSKVSVLDGAWFRTSNDLGRKDYIEEITGLLLPFQQPTNGIAIAAMVYSFDEQMRDALIHFARVDYPKKHSKAAILILTFGGKMHSDELASKSSIRHRKAEKWIIIGADWTPEATEEEIEFHKDWAHRLKQKVIELGGEDGPHNFCDSGGRRIKFFTEEQRKFLEGAKKKYDPNNLLNLNRNLVVKHTE